MEKYLKPALISGVIGGLLSAIPILNLPNCCCLWVILPVIWACFMYRKEYGFVDIGPGAALGAITGAIIGIIGGFLGIIMMAIFGTMYMAFIMNMIQSFNVPAESLQRMQLMGSSVLSSIAGIFIYTAIGALVGLIMGAIWKQKPHDIIDTTEVPPTI